MDATQPDVGLGHKRKACHIYMDKKNLPIILDFSFKLSLVKFEGTNIVFFFQQICMFERKKYWSKNVRSIIFNIHIIN